MHPDFAIHTLQNLVTYTRSTNPNIDIVVRYEIGTRTDRNRNIILKDFIKEKVDYVLWLDADMTFPPQMIERYLEIPEIKDKKAIAGCLYFKRSDDHKPIAYTDSNDPQRPFRPIMPQLIKPGMIYKVSGLGYGGMMVPMKVYDKLGDRKWTRYGENFHDPEATTGNLTHDLVFCQDVKKAGFDVCLHGSIRPGHLGTKLITEHDFYDKFPPRLLDGLRVLVVMPAIDMELAQKAAEVMKARAGYDCEIRVVEDEKRVGFIETINSVFKAESQDFDFVVYTAQDAFVGQNWLAKALVQQFKDQASVVAFNDGKWNGKLASFGMVEVVWAKTNYDGELFFKDYHSHYGDTELTQIAKLQHSYTYAKDAVMLEVDYNKAIGKGKGLVKADKKLYNKRIKTLVSKELAEEFS